MICNQQSHREIFNEDYNNINVKYQVYKVLAAKNHHKINYVFNPNTFNKLTSNRKWVQWLKQDI